MALTQAERRKAVDLIHKLLGMVDEGDLAVDGPAGVALVRRLEGAVIALRAMDSSKVPVVETGPREPGVRDS